jgi:hypothetical protein
MDKIYEKLEELEKYMSSGVGRPGNLIDALEYESSMMYIYLSLSICKGKLTNELDERQMKKAMALQNNFEICEKYRKDGKIEVNKEVEDFLSNMYPKRE